MQRLLSVARSHLFIFVFISLALGDRSKVYCYDLHQKVFCLCSLLGLMCIRSLIHFEFIFEYGVRKCSNLFLLCVAVQEISIPFVEEIVFSPTFILASFVVD